MRIHRHLFHFAILLTLSASGQTTNVIAKFDGVSPGSISDSVLVESGGKIGIGTTSPANALHLMIVDGAVNVPLKVQSTGPDSITGLSLKNDVRNWHLRVDGTDGDKLKIFDANANAYRLTVDDTGNIGIGTTTPTSKLHVIGNVTVSGSITGATVIGATYQDVAEWVPASTDMSAGTVVVLNPDKANEVQPSLHAYDTAVAGVVSPSPGVILGVPGDSKEQIATTGRVKVRVDARLLPVRIGDLLVTSDLPGTAQRSEPMTINGRQFHQPGTILGKALEPLNGGVGEILVLLSMQ